MPEGKYKGKHTVLRKAKREKTKVKFFYLKRVNLKEKLSSPLTFPSVRIGVF